MAKGDGHRKAYTVSMKHIITVQHTQSIHHINGMVGSWTDWELTDFGKQQADLIGKKLAEELDSIVPVIYSSDLLRARQTAEIIANHLGVSLILREELRERNLGKCCGRSVQWLRGNMEAQEKTVDDRMFSDAESIRDVWNRLEPFFNEMLHNDHETIIIVSHGGLLSVFNAMFIGLDVEAMNNGNIHGRSGGVSSFMIRDDGKRSVQGISDMSYLIEEAGSIV
ncbi:MAG: histidine phosphatase family protein [Oscillospiraceae bacterium]|nr:histidine phosphatase family protein [Oscillospiraceae bacterium]